jgi:nitroreductase
LKLLPFKIAVIETNCTMNKEALNQLIARRRSLYPNNYSDEKVPDAIIRQMLENANWAPTHGMTEPWSFVVFTGEGLKRLASFQSELYRDIALKNETYNEVKFQKLSENPLKASHVIALGMKRDPREKIPEIEEVAAVACAVQNMYLTATANEVGCYWGSGGITYMEEAKSFFGLDTADKLLGFLYVGYPKIDWPAGKRSPIAEKVTWYSE